MKTIHCPKDIGLVNTFDGEDCKKEQFYNNCYHCWGCAIAKKTGRTMRREQMTNQKAIEVLKKELQIIDDSDVTMTMTEWGEHEVHMKDALNIAIDALKKQSPCDMCEYEEKDWLVMCQYCPAEPKGSDEE